MANVAGNIEYFAAVPMLSRIYQSQVFDLGATGDEYTRINMTVTDQFRIQKLDTLAVEQNGTVATQIGYDDADVAQIEVFRGGVPITAPIASKRTFFKGNSATQIATWCWDPRELRSLPSLLPADVVRIQIPPVDDNGVPTADCAVTAGYIIVER